MRRPLRMLFFSDWRIQSLELIRALIASVAPLDVILYGGDDVVRFAPCPEPPDRLQTGQHTYGRDDYVVPEDMQAVMELAWEQAGCFGEQPSYHGFYMLTPRKIFSYFHDRSPEHNALSRLASYSRHGILGILGNDCPPEDRVLLEAPGVRDLHSHPVDIDGVGFVGIEGGITDGERNAIGYLLHPEEQIHDHLMNSVAYVRSTGADVEQLVVMSHTPPAGCGLDTAVRFGIGHLGSEVLADFIQKERPALVLCGHCHSQGGKSTMFGDTLVVNGASDDQKQRAAHVALIELGDPGTSPNLTWLDPLFGLAGPDIGISRAMTLQASGITALEQIPTAPPEVLRAIQFGPTRLRRLETFLRARATNSPVLLEPLALPDRLDFYDVETGLIGSSQGLIAEAPWLIGAFDGVQVRQWIVPEPDPVKRRDMYDGFLTHVEGRAQEGYTLCSWSGTRFDESAIDLGIQLAGVTKRGYSSDWGKDRLSCWRKIPKLDLLIAIKKQVVIPLTSWSLKPVAAWCGFTYTGDMDGFEAGLRYEAFLKYGESLPEDKIARYNAEDLRALACVTGRLRQAHYEG